MIYILLRQCKKILIYSDIDKKVAFSKRGCVDKKTGKVNSTASFPHSSDIYYTQNRTEHFLHKN